MKHLKVCLRAEKEDFATSRTVRSTDGGTIYVGEPHDFMAVCGRRRPGTVISRGEASVPAGLSCPLCREFYDRFLTAPTKPSRRTRRRPAPGVAVPAPEDHADVEG